MEVETGQVENFNEASDAGDKMASANVSENANIETAAASSDHELKIMDVEGSVIAEELPEERVPMVILVDDDDDDPADEDRLSHGEHELADTDMDDDHAPMVAELQSALNNPDEKPLDDNHPDEREPEADNVSTKTEPSSDAESNHSYADPMGLLERLDTQDAESQDDDEDFSMDDSSNEKTLFPRKKMPRAKRWLLWMKRWPWILHEDSDATYAFCLYCNMNINVNNRAKHIQQHNMSLYHQERECNYVAFKKSEEQTRGTTSDIEVKHEFGTNSYVAAMKQKRASEIEAFNNFNWLRWLRWHPWLERAQPTGTVGMCRVCNVRMNVEFVYLRKRHEASKGHLEAVRLYDSDKPNRKRKRSKSVAEAGELASEQQPIGEQEGEEEDTAVVMMNGDMYVNDDPGRWCELIPDTSPQQCRCTLCNCRMVITSFLRHCKAKIHCQNSMELLQKRPLQRGIWSVYADVHPWMVADPEDPSIAYCSICQKRFMYGNSEIKRKNHENSEKHTSAVAAQQSQEIPINDADDEANPAENPLGEGELGVPALLGAPSDSDGSEEDYNNVTDDNWSETQRAKKTNSARSVGEQRKAKIRAGIRFYPWLCYSKDRKVQLCKFCRVRFHNDAAKARHEFSARHQKLVKQYKARQALLPPAEKEGHQDEEEELSNTDSGTVDTEKLMKQVRPSSAKAFAKPIPATIKGKVMVWKARFPWLSYKKSEERRNYGWCKLCEVSVFIPTSKFASKHQRSTRHIRLRIERKKAGAVSPETTSAKNSDNISAAVATAAALTTGEAKHKAAMAELQAKYNWLEPDANDENHCHCRICETRLPIKLFYLRQHDSSRKHSENLERQKAAAVPPPPAASHSTSEATAEAEVQESGLEVDKESDADLSLRSDGSTAEPPSKRSRRSMEVRRILRALRDSMGRRQDERSQLDMAKDMICSSFDIVSRLRTLERETVAPTPGQPNDVSLKAPEPRHVVDLFFDSIAPTMKALPADLAAEGKAKIMQLVCGLEVKAMQRTSAAVPGSSSGSGSTADSLPTAKSPPNAANPEVPSSVITIPDDDQKIQNNNEQQGSPSKRKSTGTFTPVTLNGNHNDVAENLRRMLNNTQIKVTNRQDPEAVRCVPLDKLTSLGRINGGRHSIGSALEASSNQPTDLSNGNAVGSLRQIRVNNNNNSKIISLPKPIQQPQLQQQHHQMQPQMQQQQLQQHIQSSSAMIRNNLTSNGAQLPQYRPMINHNRRP
ncbi:uncharacterized protein Dana_GF17587 [Drosophila ananassae]|uniref:BESS domain-containing protein n=1 Tax=Drosophila ananassae TaxID=7217 RepID=B3LX54_DROAN|nr:protein suppressor of variegation 3-7 [Drosophila ananassae]EDV41654.1 uncharacterized protein Dana_GF17587 [Drosophila ananassae]